MLGELIGIGDVLDALGLWHFENAQYAGAVRVKRCTHLLMLVDWLREQVIAGYLELAKVATEATVADLLTKIVTGGEFKRKAELLLG